MERDTTNLIAFLVLAFAWSWLLWLPRVLAALGYTGVPQGPNIAALGPSVAAFIIVFATRGLDGAISLAKRAFDVGFAARWWLAILLVFPAINGGIILLDYLLRGTLPAFPWTGELVAVPVAFVIVVFTTGPVQEEFGWRGYALDRLQSRYSALVASLVLGIIWAAWHIPLFLFEEASIYQPENAIGFLPSVILVTIIITWVYNNTGGSLLAAILLHASFNFSHWALPVFETDFARQAYLFVLVAAAVVVVRFGGPRNLSRRYQRRADV